MKKLFYLTLSFLIFTNCAFAVELQGGVKYSVDSARDYVQDGIPDGVEISDDYYKFQAKSADKVVYSYNNSNEVVGITVQYINEPMMSYIYGRDKTLLYVNKYDKSVNIYPHRGYRYDLNGKLDLTSLIVSPSEQFRFSPSGKLLAHSVNGVIYDENNAVIGHGK